MRHLFEPEWAMHDLDHWHGVSANPVAPGPLRIAAIGYAQVTGNGHVPVSNDDLVETLYVLDKSTGEISPPSLSSVKRWRADAVRFGLLDEATWARCLVLPRGVRTKLPGKGSPFRECLICKHR